ncbi:imelysin family protein [Pseudorhodoferax sp.]|uniref:imelysin family protein n=1 Tax=Pseudorhodoferax sp. TaxID=1993553 RepID=UPI0039E377B6
MAIDAARRRLMMLAGLACAAAPALAQRVPANVALPFYGPPAFMQGAWRRWYAPRARDFAQRAQALAEALSAQCRAGDAAALQAARAAWGEAMLAFARLSAVSVGPLLQRRSVRQIDFMPRRPELVRRAIAAAPADLAALERVGTPAKGLPALEWLLWSQPPSGAPTAGAGAPACRYAELLGAHLLAEARALEQAFAALAAASPDPDDEDAAQAAAVAMSELVNQWIGGVERLRWPFMDKPLKSAPKGKPPAYPRAASGLTAQAWAAHWEALRTLAVATDDAIPQPGADLVALETYMRGRGLNPLADRWAAAVGAAGTAVAAARPEAAASVQAAARAVGGLKQLAEAELAPALDIRIGFSDADGD